MTKNLKPVRVKLLKWEKEPSNNLFLHFEKVQTHISSRDFTKKEFPVAVFSDFGYIDITLFGIEINHDFTWLNEYINDSNVFIEEENLNELSFIEGTDIDGYDWSESYEPIKFESKKMTYSSLSEEEWKNKYIEMTLKWENLFHERYDIVHNDFLSLFIEVTKGKINTLMPESKSEDLIQFKSSLRNELDSWLRGFEEKRKETEELYSKSENKSLNNQNVQQSVNSELKGFWSKLIDKFK